MSADEGAAMARSTAAAGLPRADAVTNPKAITPVPHTWILPPLTWRETFSRIRSDYQRLAATLTVGDERPPGLALHPSFLAVLLYRIANHVYRTRHTFLARLVWQANLMLTGADINAAADLGPGLVIMHPPGTAIMGTAGRNLTVMPCGGLGGEVGRRFDVGAGPGLPLLGDDVILEPHSGALGPVRIGDRVRICAGIAFTEDVPSDTIVEHPKPRLLRRRDIP